MRTSTSRLLFFALVHTACVFADPPTDGLLDTAFDLDGKQKLAFDRGGYNIDLPSKVVPTPTGAYVFGVVETGVGDSVSTITRLNLDGSVDTSGYGEGGTVNVDMLDGYYDEYVLADGAVQADGKLVAVGQAATGDDVDILVCRFLPDGTIDQGFGDEDGCTRVDFENIADDICLDTCDEAGPTVAIQPNQRIVLASSFNSNSKSLVVAARLTAGGAYDPSFSDPDLNHVPGRVLVDIAELGSKVERILIDALNRIVIGYSKSEDPFGCDYDLAAKRLLQDGSLDSSFNNGSGVDVSFNLGGYTTSNGCSNWRDRLADVAVLNNGSILLGGEAEVSAQGTNYVPRFKGVIVKINAIGKVDLSWGQQGMIFITACDLCTSTRYSGFGVDAQGRLLLAGHTTRPGSLNNTSDVIVTRLSADGTLDPTFGDGALGELGHALYGFDAPGTSTNEMQVGLRFQNGAPLLLTTTVPYASFNADFGLLRLRDDRIFRSRFELVD